MKRTLSCLFILTVFILSIKCQVTIGSDSPPHKDAILDLKQTRIGESYKGLLLPRVYLSKADSPTPLEKHVKGILVYNLSEGNNLNKGVYLNTGNNWLLVGTPSKYFGSQVLEINDEGYPIWVSLDTDNVVDKEKDTLILTKSRTSIGSGIDLTKNSGIDITKLESNLDSNWKILDNSFSITPKNATNKLVITVQTTVQNDSMNNPIDGWTTFTGGIFLNAKLKKSVIEQITYTKSGQYQFKTFIFTAVLENSPINEQQNIVIASARISSASTDSRHNISIGKAAGNANNINKFMAEPHISYLYYESTK